MESNEKMIRFLIGAVVIVAIVYFAYGMLGSGKGNQSPSQYQSQGSQAAPAEGSSDSSDPSSQDSGQQASPAGQESAPAVSTPQERASRSASPSDAASYSEDDLPPEYE